MQAHKQTGSYTVWSLTDKQNCAYFIMTSDLIITFWRLISSKGIHTAVMHCLNQKLSISLSGGRESSMAKPAMRRSLCTTYREVCGACSVVTWMAFWVNIRMLWLCEKGVGWLMLCRSLRPWVMSVFCWSECGFRGRVGDKIMHAQWKPRCLPV